jgi:hypothetical protein
MNNFGGRMKKLALLSLIFTAVLKTYSLDLETNFIFGEVSPGFETDFSSFYQHDNRHTRHVSRQVGMGHLLFAVYFCN